MRLILEKKVWKLHEASVQKFFKDHLNQAICYLASLKAYTSKINSWETFFQFHKMGKSLWDRLPFFSKQCLKTRKNGLFQMPELFVYKKMTSLKLAESGQFFFHANYRIPVCEPTTKYFWWNRLPVHVNMTWALGLKWFWMKQFFTVAVLFFFVTKYFCKFPIWRIVITYPC